MKPLVAKSGCRLSFPWVSSDSEMPSMSEADIVEAIDSIDETFEVVVLSDCRVYPSKISDIPRLPERPNGGVEYKTTLEFDGPYVHVDIPYIPNSDVQTLVDQLVTAVEGVGDSLSEELNEYLVVADVEPHDVDPSIEDLEENPYKIIHPILSDHVICEMMGELNWYDNLEKLRGDIKMKYDSGTAQSTGLVESQEEAEELSQLLNWELQSDMSMGIESLSNPFQSVEIEEIDMLDGQASDLVSTEALVPWLYKYGGDAVTLWNYVQDELFRTPDRITHPVFAPDEELYEYMTKESELTRVQYIKMVYDLFQLLRHEHPIVESDWQRSLVADAYEQLGYPDVDVNSESIGPTWENIVVDGELRKIAQLLHEKNSDVTEAISMDTFPYPIMSYTDIMKYNNDSFSYGQTDVPNYIRPGETVLVPSEYTDPQSNLSQYGVHVIYQLRNYGFIPPYVTMRDEVLPGVQHRNVGVLLPRAVWWDPIGVCIDKETQPDGYSLHVEDLRDISSYCGGTQEMESSYFWEPACWEQINNAQLVEEFSIGPHNSTELFGEIEGSIPEFVDDDNVRLEELSYWFEKMEEHDVFDKPAVVYHPYNQSVHDENGWQTGVSIGEFPMYHSSMDKEVIEGESMYVRCSVNKMGIHDDDETRAWGVRPMWEKIFPGGIKRLQRMTSADHARDVLEREGQYEPDGQVVITQVPAPVFLPSQVILDNMEQVTNTDE